MSRGRSKESSIKSKLDQVLDITQDIKNRYPEDIFPVDGTSLECAGARFARGILNEVEERVRELQEATRGSTDELTPKELSEKFGLSSTTTSDRLHHRNCPMTKRHTGPTGRLTSVELTPELEKFLSQPAGSKFLR